jgi:hypothetical protein
LVRSKAWGIFDRDVAKRLYRHANVSDLYWVTD